jgi:LysM repeat protein
MKLIKLPFVLCFLFATQLLFAQSSDVVRQYIERYKDIAMAEMQRTGVPASITLAQGIHETQAGTSDLVVASNNHFGIKCKGDWTGETVSHDDDAKGECFRKYSDPADSYKDHSDFLKNRPNYAFLFRIDPMDYEAWAWGLKKAGYATNPKYPQILIRLIHDYNLQDYTLIAIGKKTTDPNSVVWASNTEKGTGNTAQVPAPEQVKVQTAYPSGIFRINETNAIFVSKGTPFLKIAEENHISLSRLYEFNDIEATDLTPNDQLIFLQRKRKAGAHEFHEVTSGETIYDIAQAEGIRMENLLALNFLKPGMQPQAGERVYLQKQAPSMPRLALIGDGSSMLASSERMLQSANYASYGPDYIAYVVQPKETVYGIARKYDVTVDDLVRWNDLKGTDLKTGQILKINKRSLNAANQTAR